MVLLLFKVDLKLLQEIIKGNRYPNVPRKLIKVANHNDVSKKKACSVCSHKTQLQKKNK